MRTRTILALAVALTAPGCFALTFDVENELVEAETVPGETTTVALASATHDPVTDALTFVVRDDTTRRSEQVDRYEEDRSWTVEYMSLTDHLWTETDSDAALFLLIITPVTLAVDLMLPLGSLIVAPFRVAFGDLGESTTRTPHEAVEQRPWTPLELYDPTTGARAPVVDGTRAGDLALLGFRSTALTAIGPDGQERPLALPASVAPVLEEVAEGWDRAAEELRVRVPLGASLAEAARRAPDGAWLQLEAGDYPLESTLFLHGRRLTLAGRGAGATRLLARSLALNLSGTANEVTLRGLTVQLDGSSASDAVRVTGGATTLVGCAISGAAYEELPPPPPEPAKPGEPPPPPQGKSYRGGVGLAGTGEGLTTLRACRLAGNGTAGVMARDLHQLRVLGCAFDGGALEAISFRGDSKDNLVSGCTVRGPNHAIVVSGQTAAEVQRSDLSAPNAGILTNGEAALTASDNTIHGCGTGISIEGKSTAALWRNACDGNRTGILIGTEGTHAVVRENRCTGSAANGISLQAQASAEVRGNTCARNLTGVLVSGTSQGAVSDNVLEANETGLAFQDHGAAAATGNKLRENTLMGLQISGQSSPVVSGNEIRSNRRGGVILQGDAGTSPTLTDNDICDNAGNGVQVGAGLAPTITRNRIANNSGAGVIGAPGVTYTAPFNTFTNNGDQRGY